ncbi:tetratricopeptide repeat protein [Maridesulfovibrio sp.]|uniref:tetratricopeptide repeat protein n=1 Tax=Maridesulfovibrio sp. TaxID=2795000 RepID=UPI003BABC487
MSSGFYVLKTKLPVLLSGILLCFICMSCKTADKPTADFERGVKDGAQLGQQAEKGLVNALKQVRKNRTLFKDRESYPSLKDGFTESYFILAKNKDADKAAAALAAMDKGDVRPAANWFKDKYLRDVQIDPQGAAVSLRYCGLLKMFYDPASGVNILYRASGHEPGNYQAMMNLGIYLNRMRKYPNAEVVLRKTLYQAQKAEDEAIQGIVSSEIAYSYRMRGKGKLAKKYFLNSVEKSKVAGNDHRVAVGYFQLGMICEQLKDFYSAEIYYSRALKEYEKFGWKKDIAAMNLKLGRLYVDQQNWLLSEGYIRKAVSGYQNTDYKLGLAMSYLLYADFYMGQQKADQALASYGKALNLYKSLKMRESVAKIHKDMGFIKFDKQQPIEAMNDWIQALKIYTDLGAEKEVDAIYAVLGLSSFTIGDMSGGIDFFQQLVKQRKGEISEIEEASGCIIVGAHELLQQNFLKAEENFLKAYNLGREHNLPEIQGMSCFSLGGLYFRQSEFEKSETLFKEARQLFSQHGDKNMIAFSDFNLGGLYLEQKKYDQAEVALTKARDLYAQLKNDEMVKILDIACKKLEKRKK